MIVLATCQQHIQLMKAARIKRRRSFLLPGDHPVSKVCLKDMPRKTLTTMIAEVLIIPIVVAMLASVTLLNL